MTEEKPQLQDQAYRKLGITDPKVIAAAEALQSGYKFNGPIENGKMIITYSFGADPKQAQDGFVSSVSPPTDAQKQLMLAAMREYERELNVEFREAKTPEAANIKVFGAEFNGTSVNPATGEKMIPAGDGSYPIDAVHSTIRLNNAFITNPSINSDNFLTAMHELGHSLGLKHPFDGEPLNGRVASAPYNQLGQSVMAYDDSLTHNADLDYRSASTDRAINISPRTLMPLDIVALQADYGANKDGNTRDNFSGKLRDGPRIIYHGSGAHHTLDVSNITEGRASLFLDSGTVSLIGEEQAVMAHGTKIDRVVGGNVDFSAVGSAGHVTFVGGHGDNALVGSGNDVFIAGENHNNISTGPGKNLIQLNGGMDNIQLRMNGSDTVRHFDNSRDKLFILDQSVDRAERYEVDGKQVLLFTSAQGEKLIVTLDEPKGAPVSSVTLGSHFADPATNKEIAVTDKGRVTAAQMQAIEVGADMQNAGKHISSPSAPAAPPARRNVHVPDR